MKSLLALAVPLLLFQPALMFWASQLKQNCDNGSYAISVLMMGNTAYKEPMQNLQEAVEEGLDIVRKRLREAGKTMVKDSFFLCVGFCFKAESWRALPHYLNSSMFISELHSLSFLGRGVGVSYRPPHPAGRKDEALTAVAYPTKNWVSGPALGFLLYLFRGKIWAGPEISYGSWSRRKKLIQVLNLSPNFLFIERFFSGHAGSSCLP